MLLAVDIWEEKGGKATVSVISHVTFLSASRWHQGTLRLVETVSDEKMIVRDKVVILLTVPC